MGQAKTAISGFVFRSSAPALDSLRDSVSSEHGWNTDTGRVQVSGRDVEGLCEGGSHAPCTTIQIIMPNLHHILFSLHPYIADHWPHAPLLNNYHNSWPQVFVHRPHEHDGEDLRAGL